MKYFLNLDKIKIKNNLDDRLALRELFIFKKINEHRNIARVYECIVDEGIDKIVFVMEYCDLGELMKYNSDATGYDYNSIFIKFLIKKLFIENYSQQRKPIFDIVCSKKDKILVDKISKIRNYLDKIDEGRDTNHEDEISKINFEDVESFIFDIFKKYLKLRIYFTKIIFKQLVKAIQYLHSINICNRDIKPENILCVNNFYNKSISEGQNEKIIPDNFVKMIDFSISKYYENKDIKIISTCGSDLFKSPEMLNLEYFNPFKAEIYSLGVTILYFLFKKFYKSNSLKHLNEEEFFLKVKDLENQKSLLDENNNLIKDNSKFMVMRSSSLLLRPRKSSIIYNNFENLNIKEYISNVNELRASFEEADEIHLYQLLKKMLDENPDNRIDIEDILTDAFFI